MTKFSVTFETTAAINITLMVEASTEDEAEALANKRFAGQLEDIAIEPL